MREYLIWVLQISRNLFFMFGQPKRRFQSRLIFPICTDTCIEHWEQVRFWIFELGFKPMTHFLLKYSNGYGECSTNVSNQFLANFLWSRLSKHRIQCLKHLPDSHRRHILRVEKWSTSRCWKFNRGVQHRHLFSTRIQNYLWLYEGGDCEDYCLGKCTV